MVGIEDRLGEAESLLLEGDVLLSEQYLVDPFVTRGVRSLLCVPLKSEDLSLGLLCLMGSTPGVSFNEADRSFATVLASQSAVAIQNANLLGEIQRAFDETRQLGGEYGEDSLSARRFLDDYISKTLMEQMAADSIPWTPILAHRVESDPALPGRLSERSSRQPASGSRRPHN